MVSTDSASRHSRRATLGGIGAGGLAALALITPALARQESTPAASSEEESIGDVLIALGMGFANRDAEAVASLYTEDAEWLNAFGDWRQGRDEILAEMEHLFSSPDFTAGRPVGPPTGSVRLLRPEVAVAWTYQEIEGQRMIGSGAEVGTRRNHSMLVLTREGDQWLIAAQMFMDEQPHTCVPAAAATPTSE